MMRIPKFCRMGRMGRLQNRNFSSASETDNDAPGYLARMVVGVVGYMIGGVVSSPASKFLQETEEAQLEIKQELDAHEAGFEAPMK